MSEPVMCEDCAYWEGGYITEDDVAVPPRCKWHYRVSSANDTCSYGRRKQQEGRNDQQMACFLQR